MDKKRPKDAGKSKTFLDRLRQLEAKYVISVGLSILIVISSFAILFKVNYAPKKAPVQVRQGLLDLSEYDLLHTRPIVLDGDWEFYPCLFLDPLAKELPPPSYIAVPGHWDLSKDGAGVAHGFGTYRLRVILKEDGHYSLKTNSVRGAAKIFINGRELAGMGQVSQTPEGYAPDSRYLQAGINSEDRELVILFHVANFSHSQGGVLQSVKLGGSHEVARLTSQERSLELLLAASFFMVGILGIFIYWHRSKSKAILSFALACLFMCLYLTTMNNQNLALLISYNYYARTTIQMVTVMGASYCFLAFAQHFFKPLVRQGLVRFLKGFLLVICLVSLDYSLGLGHLPMTALTSLVALSLALTYSYFLYVLIKAVRQRYQAVEYIIVVTASLFSYWMALVFKILFEFKMGIQVESILYFVLFSLTFMVAHRLQEEYLQAVQLTEERLEREFKYFFSQISPHFLYNTINTIIGLSYEDTDKSREALRNLALYFRGKLDLHLHKGLISLENDIDMARAYLEIEKLRYGDKLNLVLDIESDLEAMIPPLTLQPLAENAVRHGIVPKEGEGTVEIRARALEGGGVEVTVSDDGVGISYDRMLQIREGDLGRLGMQNILNKISLMKGASVDFTSQPDRGTTIRIYLPEGDEV